MCIFMVKDISRYIFILQNLIKTLIFAFSIKTIIGWFGILAPIISPNWDFTTRQLPLKYHKRLKQVAANIVCFTCIYAIHVYIWSLFCRERERDVKRTGEATLVHQGWGEVITNATIPSIRKNDLIEPRTRGLCLMTLSSSRGEKHKDNMADKCRLHFTKSFHQLSL